MTNFKERYKKLRESEENKQYFLDKKIERKIAFKKIAYVFFPYMFVVFLLDKYTKFNHNIITNIVGLLIIICILILSRIEFENSKKEKK